MHARQVNKPAVFTVLSPSLLHLYDLQQSIVVIIDILRATSTIATALYNGAKEIIPVDSVAECIRLSKQMDAISAGERDGKVAEGLEYGNSPFEYGPEFINGKTLVLTTTNGTRLLHKALAANASEIITGSFCNFSAVKTYLKSRKKNVILACAAWRDKVNIEDTLFAGALVHALSEEFEINCDASHMAESLYLDAKDDLFAFMKNKKASHYNRLMGYDLEKDIRYCLTFDNANAVNLYQNGRLVLVRED